MRFYCQWLANVPPPALPIATPVNYVGVGYIMGASWDNPILIAAIEADDEMSARLILLRSFPKATITVCEAIEVDVDIIAHHNAK